LKKPRRLYKYQSVTARTLENLKLRTIWFSAPSAFNDPFDCAVDVVLKDLDEADLARAYEYLSSRAEIAKELESEMITDGRPNDRFRELIDSTVNNTFRPQIHQTRGRVGVACFSAKNDDLLMWGHYADGHRGFCLEFDASVQPFSKGEPVQYQNSNPEVNPLDVLDGCSTGQNIIEAMLRTKHTCWQYEQEWRLIHQQAGMAYTYPYEALTGVYLGAAMPTGQKDLIGQLLHGSPAQLYEMKRGASGFIVASSPVTYTPFECRTDHGAKAR